MRILQYISLQLILLAFASLVDSFQFTNTAWNPVLGQQFTITWVDSTGSVDLHLIPLQYYNASIPLANEVLIGVAPSGNALPWTPDESIQPGVYKIYWVPSDNTLSEVDSPTFTLGQMPASSSTNTNSASSSHTSSSSSSGASSATETSTATTTSGAVPSSSSTANAQPEANQSNSISTTVKISIAVSIILGITLIMVVAFILIRRRRYLAIMPRTKRQLATKDLSDNNDSWYGGHHFKSELPAESEDANTRRSYVNLVKKKHLSVNVEPVEMGTYVMKDMKETKLDDRKVINERNERNEDMGLGLGLGDVEELVEPKELDASATLGEAKIGHRFDGRYNVNIIGI